MRAVVCVITFEAKAGLIALKIIISLLMVEVTSHPERRMGFQLHCALRPWFFPLCCPRVRWLLSHPGLTGAGMLWGKAAVI